ncbi:hypothetical protein Trydic_g12487, partial [Trypoxylus dichotomus]
YGKDITKDRLNQCGIEIRWCTTSKREQRKCEAWRKASFYNAIQPIPTCVQKSGKRECIEAIRTNKADAVTIHADLGYSAKLDGLETIAYLETKGQSLVHVALVVKSNIMSLESLKGKKGCFPLYGGVAWLTFIDFTRSTLLNNATYKYAQVLHDRLGSSCMPGARLKDLCSLCVSISIQ